MKTSSKLEKDSLSNSTSKRQRKRKSSLLKISINMSLKKRLTRKKMKKTLKLYMKNALLVTEQNSKKSSYKP